MTQTNRHIGRLGFAACWAILAAICLSTCISARCWAAEPVAAAAEFPPELVRFTEYPHNPIFTAGAAGAWDARIRERGWILRDGGQWRMWYTGYDGSPEGLRMLGTATSADGLAWTRDAHNPIYRDHWVEDMMVVHRGGTWTMFAEGKDDQAQWLTSNDGVHWKREGALDIRLTNGKPISPGAYGTPTAWCEGDTWYLLYERHDRGVLLATSSDLKVWTHVQDEPVLKPGPDAYDREMIAVNQVIQYGGRYYAYYHGSGDVDKPRTWSTSVAVSTDRVHWKKYSGNPIVPGDRSSGIVVEVDGKYRLYTMHDAVRVYLPPPANKQ